jgi:hypothetical protein
MYGDFIRELQLQKYQLENEIERLKSNINNHYRGIQDKEVNHQIK